MKESRRKKKKKPVKWTFDGGNVSGKDDAAVKCDTPRVLAASASPEVFTYAQRWLKYLTIISGVHNGVLCSKALASRVSFLARSSGYNFILRVGENLQKEVNMVHRNDKAY